MNCYVCNADGWITGNSCSHVKKCSRCNGTGKLNIEDLTYDDWVRTATTKQLAVMLVTIALYPMDFKPYVEYLKKCGNGATEKDFVEMTEKWLKSKTKLSNWLSKDV